MQERPLPFLAAPIKTGLTAHGQDSNRPRPGKRQMYRISPFIRIFALALLSGAGLATLIVNLWPEAYYDAVEFRLFDLPLSVASGRGPVPVTPLGLVSDFLMPLFYFFIGKELWEALVVERAAHRLVRAPALPLGAFLGSATGSVAAWLVAVALVDPSGEMGLRAGWPVGIGSDVVICYLLGRAAFGAGHPALHLLLLLTVAQDVAALCIAAIAAQDGGAGLAWLLLSPLAALAVWTLFGRHARAAASERAHLRAARLAPYVVAGAVSWAGFTLAGLPPELGLLPVIPAIPHAGRSFGIFAEAEGLMHDPLNRLATALVRPLGVALFLFGLTRGGIEVDAFGPGTGAALAAFWLGKPLGLLAGASLAMTFAGARLPEGLRLADLGLIALVTATGFTSPLTVLDLTLHGGLVGAEARLGLALSLAVAPVVLAVALVLRGSVSLRRGNGTG